MDRKEIFMALFHKGKPTSLEFGDVIIFMPETSCIKVVRGSVVLFDEDGSDKFWHPTPSFPKTLNEAVHLALLIAHLSNLSVRVSENNGDFIAVLT